MQDIIEATAEYEAALAARMPLNAGDLRYKHERMADAEGPFPFFRGTYYRWVRHWHARATEYSKAPLVLAVGDLHVENYGTWRDADTRLSWGVNDFDEAEELPYVHDLIRLAASVRLAKRSGFEAGKASAACGHILHGYAAALERGGRHFVLEEKHRSLRRLAMYDNPSEAWGKYTKLLRKPAVEPPNDARELLIESLPPDAEDVEFRFRTKAGMGSLGRPRYAAFCKYRGGLIAREVKAATVTASGRANRAAEAAGRAVRSHDPHFAPGDQWVLRRLGPRYGRIELDQLQRADLSVVFRAMGAETANVHLGTPGVAPAILADLAARPQGWLNDVSKQMAAAVTADWKEWKRRPEA